MINIKDRNPIIDISRGIGILLVLYGHALEITFTGRSTLEGTEFWQWKLIYSFHMPLFFFLSGMVYKRRPFAKVAMSSMSLIVIAIASHIIGYLIYSLHNPVHPAGIIKPILTLTHFTTKVVWFLVALAFIQALFSIIEAGVVKTYATIVALSLITIFIFERGNQTYFQIQAIAPGLFFYYAGFKLGQKKWMLRSTPSIRCATLSLIALTITWYLAPKNNGCDTISEKACRNFFDQFGVMFISGRYGFIPLFLATAITGILATLTFSSAVANCRHLNRARNKLAGIGSSTLELLFLNGFFLVFLQPYAAKNIHIESGPLSSIAWGVGITSIQLAILPATKVATNVIFSLCRAFSERLVFTFIKFFNNLTMN